MPRQVKVPSIECRHCGCRVSKVTNSTKHEVMYLGKKTTVIKRYRRCFHCNLPYTTVEAYEDEENSKLPEGVTPFKPAPEGTGISGVYNPTIPKVNVGGDVPALPPKRARRATPTSPSPEKPKASRTKRK